MEDHVSSLLTPKTHIKSKNSNISSVGKMSSSGAEVSADKVDSLVLKTKKVVPSPTVYNLGSAGKDTPLESKEKKPVEPLNSGSLESAQKNVTKKTSKGIIAKLKIPTDETKHMKDETAGPYKSTSNESRTNGSKFLIGEEYESYGDIWKGGKFEELHSLKSNNNKTANVLALSNTHTPLPRGNKSVKHEPSDLNDKYVSTNMNTTETSVKTTAVPRVYNNSTSNSTTVMDGYDITNNNIETRKNSIETNNKPLNPFSDSHTIEEQIYLIITFIYILSRTYTLFKRTNRNKISKFGHIFIHFTILSRFTINCIFMLLKNTFPGGKQILEEKYFLETQTFLNFFKFKMNLTTTINIIRLFSDTVFISSMFLFASKYFSVTSPSIYFTNSGNKSNTALKRLFIAYSILRIPVTLLLFNIYLLTPMLISTVYILEIVFLCLFLFTQSIKLSVSKTSPATKTVYASIVLLLIYGALKFGRFLTLSFSSTSLLNFVVYKSAFFVFLFLVCYLIEMFMKRTKSDFYDYYDDEELTISTTNKGVQYYVNQLST